MITYDFILYQEVWIMSEATRIPELFGSLVFNERTMEQYVQIGRAHV